MTCNTAWHPGKTCAGVTAKDITRQIDDLQLDNDADDEDETEQQLDSEKEGDEEEEESDVSEKEADATRSSPPESFGLGLPEQSDLQAPALQQARSGLSSSPRLPHPTPQHTATEPDPQQKEDSEDGAARDRQARIEAERRREERLQAAESQTRREEEYEARRQGREAQKCRDEEAQLAKARAVEEQESTATVERTSKKCPKCKVPIEKKEYVDRCPVADTAGGR